MGGEGHTAMVGGSLIALHDKGAGGDGLEGSIVVDGGGGGERREEQHEGRPGKEDLDEGVNLCIVAVVNR